MPYPIVEIASADHYHFGQSHTIIYCGHTAACSIDRYQPTQALDYRYCGNRIDLPDLNKDWRWRNLHIHEELFYYSIGFPIAKYYSRNARKERIVDRIKSLARDPFIIVALSSILIGGLLNITGISRPEFYRVVIAVFVPLATIMLLIIISRF